METANPEHFLVNYLNRANFDETRAWLRNALSGRQWLPLLSPDETQYIGILRLEHSLSKETRRDLVAACSLLIHEFVHDGKEVDLDYLNSLLQLAVNFKLQNLCTLLAEMARNFPLRVELPLAHQKLILGAIIDFKACQPKEFWYHILQQDPSAFGALAVSGLLSINPLLAIGVLDRIPDEQQLVDAISIAIEQAADGLAFTHQTELIQQVRKMIPLCYPLLRSSLKAWLFESDYLGSKDKVETLNRNSAALIAALQKRNPSFTPQPASAMLVRSAA